MRGTLSPLRKEVLERLASRGTLSREEANDGRKNSIPALLRLGWVRSVYGIRPHVVYEITDMGRRMIGVSLPELEKN
jgi:hypothetical protein